MLLWVMLQLLPVALVLVSFVVAFLASGRKGQMLGREGTHKTRRVWGNQNAPASGLGGFLQCLGR